MIGGVPKLEHKAFCAMLGCVMSASDSPKPVPGFKWIVFDPDLLGGKPAIKGTRLSVSLILGCLSEGMTPDEIAEDYPGFPKECVSEVLKFAAKETEKPVKIAAA